MKKVWLYIVAAIIVAVIILLLKKCSPVITPGVKRDTVYIPVKEESGWKPMTETSIDYNWGGGSFRGQHENCTTHFLGEESPANKRGLFNIPITDTAALLQDYYALRYYSDTTKTKYGNVVVEDSITQNRILSRNVKTDLLIPEITNTITIEEIPKFQLFAGPEVMYNFKAQAYSGGSLTLRVKKSRIYEASVLFGNNTVMYRASTKFLIFNKK